MTETDHAARGDHQPTAVLLQHIEELRAALGHAVRLLSHSAGREAADDPGHAERLMTTAAHLTDLLNRTGRAGRAPPLTSRTHVTSCHTETPGAVTRGLLLPAVVIGGVQVVASSGAASRRSRRS